MCARIVLLVMKGDAVFMEIKIPEGMKLNPNQNHVEKIMDKLRVTKGYCPCLPAKNEDTICPCKHSRTLKACRCGLFVREEA